MTEIRELHIEALRHIDRGYPVAKTTIVMELIECGAIRNERYMAELYPDGLLSGWCYDVTVRGLAMLYPQAVATGNTKRLSEATTWMD